MSTQAKEAKASTVKEAIEAVENVVEIGFDFDRLKKKASHTVEDGVVEAKRIIKRGRYAAEDFVDDTAHRIKHDPWRSVGVTFAAGIGLGVIIGWLIGRERNERCS